MNLIPNRERESGGARTSPIVVMDARAEMETPAEVRVESATATFLANGLDEANP